MRNLKCDYECSFVSLSTERTWEKLSCKGSEHTQHSNLSNKTNQGLWGRLNSSPDARQVQDKPRL